MIKTMKGFTQTETEALQPREHTTQGDYQITEISRVASRATIHCFSEKKEARGPQWKLSSLRIKKNHEGKYFSMDCRMKQWDSLTQDVVEVKRKI